MIYFIVQEEHGKAAYVKIGTSNDPEGRVTSLKTGNPHILKLWLCVPGGESIEKQFHEFFKRFHFRNEWYTFDDSFKHIILSWLDNGDMGTEIERPQPIFQIETFEYLASVCALGYDWMIDGRDRISNRYSHNGSYGNVVTRSGWDCPWEDRSLCGN